MKGFVFQEDISWIDFEVFECARPKLSFHSHFDMAVHFVQIKKADPALNRGHMTIFANRCNRLLQAYAPTLDDLVTAHSGLTARAQQVAALIG